MSVTAGPGPRVSLWAVWLVSWSALAVAYLWVQDVDLSSALYDGFALSSAAAILLGLYRHRPAKPAPWLLLAAGIALLAAGDVVYTWLDRDGTIGFPSWADASYLAGYAAIAVGIFLIFRRSGGGRGALLDTAVFVVGGGLVLWSLVIAPSLDAVASVEMMGVALAYPAMDLVLLALVLRLLMSSAERPPSVNIIAAALGFFLASDVVYALQSVAGSYTGGILDLGWLLGYALWGAAALHPSVGNPIRQSAVPAVLTRRRLALLAATAAIGPALIAAHETLVIRVDPMPVAVLSGVMFVLIVVRLAGIVHGQQLLLEERSRLQNTLRRQAVEDPLTELPNRRGFLEAVSTAVALDPLGTAVLFIDLDDFKSVNDAHGHATGDAVLRVISRRLRRSLREGDEVGRLGGDEFAVLLRDCPSELAATGFARRTLAAIGGPTVVFGQTVQPTASIGIALGTEGATGTSLVRDADLAMYRAKALGKSRSELFSQGLYEDALRALAIRRDLARVLEEDQLRLFFQPILALETGEIQGFEALLRWFHPTLGLIAPMEFISLAESSGAIVPIGRWVLREACAHAAAWQALSRSPIGVSVNLSPVQLAAPGIVADVRTALDAAGLDPRLLTLELTEVAIDDPEFASERLNTLRGWGVRISIDDFGTGFSSLSRVGGLPVQELKIDRSLIERGDEKMAAAVVQLGQALGLRLIAEGIETPAQLERMREIGCDAVQGFLLGKPVEEASVAGLIRENHERTVSAAAPVTRRAPRRRPLSVALQPPGLRTVGRSD
ncbi:MAG: hypothetical protein QOH61_797 [Chloroflexota bacterium]|jgi:diguanylate cyclase (GGDEF)-like protein|nr:hypothetical protein [Chloroflexota bacterium]